MKDWDISEQCWKGKYWKIYTRLEVSGGKQSAEGANFIFPAIHHLKRHLLWGERHITNLLPIPPRKHFKRISFSKNKVSKNSVAIRTPIQNAFYMHNSWFVYVSKKVTKITGALKKKNKPQLSAIFSHSLIRSIRYFLFHSFACRVINVSVYNNIYNSSSSESLHRLSSYYN